MEGKKREHKDLEKMMNFINWGKYNCQMIIGFYWINVYVEYTGHISVKKDVYKKCEKERKMIILTI